MTLLEISGFPFFLLSMASIYFIYLLFKWMGFFGEERKYETKTNKVFKTYQECYKEASWIVKTAEKKAHLIKGTTKQELDFEYDSMDNEQRHYMAEQRQREIENLAKELFEKYNNVKYK